MSDEYLSTTIFFKDIIQSIAEGRNVNNLLNILARIEGRLGTLDREREEVRAGNPFFINQLSEEARANVDEVINAITDFYTESGYRNIRDLDIKLSNDADEGIITEDERLNRIRQAADGVMSRFPQIQLEGPQPTERAPFQPIIKLPMFPTGKDFLPPNITLPPEDAYKFKQETERRQMASDLGKAPHIDVPYFTTSDNIERLFENNKLKSELSTGTSAYYESIRQWHRLKDNVRFNKYGPRRDPVQIEKPFKGWPADFP